ncbi:hypothetical protein CYMTET_26772 [Cymbomonas tetramitiformis]|uniref:Uncharacterized protein n=1 Tax=Cymbomonas tetramitiformis TaxID=36881 RepID=A0AAE0FRU0_9CHLO|nr:hypothetical protein CYMTET_26772 [Cymbomonas tetramitiformis]
MIEEDARAIEEDQTREKEKEVVEEEGVDGEEGESEEEEAEQTKDDKADDMCFQSGIVVGVTDEGLERWRVLVEASKRYEASVQSNPKDFSALYNWALILQEQAESTTMMTGVLGKEELLSSACQKYEAAAPLTEDAHSVLYNWGVALSDRAKLCAGTPRCRELWEQACTKYEQAVRINAESTQAFNNWGLALQQPATWRPLEPALHLFVLHALTNPVEAAPCVNVP